MTEQNAHLKQVQYSQEQSRLEQEPSLEVKPSLEEMPFLQEKPFLEEKPLLEQEALLKKEISSLQNLLELAQRKKEALLQEDLDNLVRLLKQEEDELKKLEDIRSKGHQPLANSSEKLEGLYNERKRIAQEVKDVNFFNQQLIDDSLAYIHFILHILQGENGKNTYGAKGIMKTKGNSPLIDLKG